MTLFDPAAAVVARDEAMAAVKDHADPEWWNGALAAVRSLAERFDRFTTDAVWSQLNIDGAGKPHEARAMGAVMRRATKNGWVVATPEYVKSARVACHARPVRVWRSLLRREA